MNVSNDDIRRLLSLMKDYRKNELKYYVIACIVIFIWVHFKNNISELTLWNIINPLIISPALYVFTFILDSVYDSDAKFKIIYGRKGKPSRRIFSEIADSGKLPWFTSDDAKDIYKDIYDGMPQGKACSDYQEEKWYGIYFRYRDKGIKALDTSAADFRLLRDINIATINLIVLYLIYCVLSQDIYYMYLALLIFAAVITNISARVKGKRWVYNVVSYDINKKKAEKKSVSK